jgi:hypothetical protein
MGDILRLPLRLRRQDEMSGSRVEQTSWFDVCESPERVHQLIAEITKQCLRHPRLSFGAEQGWRTCFSGPWFVPHGVKVTLRADVPVFTSSGMGYKVD